MADGTTTSTPWRPIATAPFEDWVLVCSTEAGYEWTVAKRLMIEGAEVWLKPNGGLLQNLMYWQPGPEPPPLSDLDAFAWTIAKKVREEQGDLGRVVPAVNDLLFQFQERLTMLSQAAVAMAGNPAPPQLPTPEEPAPPAELAAPPPSEPAVAVPAPRRKRARLRRGH